MRGPDRDVSVFIPHAVAAAVAIQDLEPLYTSERYLRSTGSSAKSDHVALVVEHGGYLQMSAERLHVGAQRR